jgi:type IV secretion system protein VirB9
MMRAHLFAPLLLIIASIAAPVIASAETPIVTDSRIKTFVYNENEVFNVVTHYGYQSNIEFGANESIEAISVGDRVGWQITPSGRRLFVRAMEDKAHTNMTVVTNKRAYQFDLREAGTAALLPSEELVYVIRFYYPDEPGMTPPPPVVDVSALVPASPVTSAPLAPVTAPATIAPVPASRVSQALNYNYTFTGTGSATPTKIYDDGHATYFTFAATSIKPRIAVISASGKEISIPTNRNSEGIWMVNTIASRFIIKSGNSRVIVYNESANAS